MINANEARVNITWQGKNGDLADPVPFDATDGDIRQWVTEAVRSGIPNIAADLNANFADYVIDRFTAAANPGPGERDYNLIQVRPKTPFGA